MKKQKEKLKNEPEEKPEKKKIKLKLPPVTPPVALSGVVLGVLLVLLFAYQFFAVSTEDASRASLEESARHTAREISSKLDQVKSRLKATLDSNPAIRALEENDAGMIRQIEERVSRQFPDAISVKLYPADLDTVDGLSFGTRAMLDDAMAKPGTSLPGEIRNIGSAQPYMNVTEVIMGSTGKPVGVFLLAMPTAFLNQVISGFSGGHYVELQQHFANVAPVRIKSQGALDVGQKPQIVKVPGSYLEIAYASKPMFRPLPFENSLLLMLGIIAGLFLALSSLIAFKAAKKIQAAGPQRVARPVVAERSELGVATEENTSHKPEPQAVDEDDDKSLDMGSSVKLSEEIFRAYDIRGIVGKSLDEDIAREIGKAIASEAIDREQKEIAVGRDGRHSGPDLAGALMEGMITTGINVIDLGMVPTGVLYFATYHLGTNSGVVVTGSHNPADYNGFKTMLGGVTLSGDDIKALYKRIVDKNFHTGEGDIQQISILEDYVDRIAGDIQLEEPIKVVLDCGNGVPGMIAPTLFTEIGCEVVPLYCDVDGDFPNHHPDPGKPENLQDLVLSVKELGADIGLAFDGDGDRLGVVTKEGEIIYPDRLLMLFAQDVLSRNPGSTIIFDVKCSNHLASTVLANGGSPLMWKTGHSFIKNKMKEVDAPLAGEMSGHFFFKERWYGFDDGLYAGARLLEILANDPRSAEEIFEGLPQNVGTPELNIQMQEGETVPFMMEFASSADLGDARITTIDGVRADYEDGWGLVRTSNTTPVLVLRFEAENADALKRIQNAFRQNLLKVRPGLDLPF